MEMNDRQNTVVATTLCSLLLVIVFLCPWRVESTNEIQWSPIYQPPMVFVQASDTDPSTRGTEYLEQKAGHVAIDVMALQVLVVGLTGTGFFVLLADSDDEDEPRSPPLS